MTFSYHRSLAPMMWVFFALVLIETAVVHLLVALWSPIAALLLSIGSLSALIWLVMLIRSLRTRPVRIAHGRLYWPVGILRALDVDLSQVAGLRDHWDGELLKARSTFNATLIAYPNVVIDLKAPIMMGRRPVERLAHKLDDRDAFTAALGGLMGRYDRR